MPASSPFPYFVGAQNLHDLANRRSRVCVMNILGTESLQVTPMSHVFSGGNVVAGVQYGSTGEELETSAGPIPVYGSVTEVLKHGHGFDTGVIYLPPAAVSHAVSELCVHNEELKRIFIVSEKVAVRDSRMIRYVAQNRRVDVLGANSLGIGNSWDQVRIGGGLGGDSPSDCLKRGSIAIYSNSGNFCTTLAEYLKTCGFGTSTIFSSGKDLYIHFALAEFLYCAENDPRTKAVVVYSEPGGYYEKQALDWISEGRLPFSKPLVVCVTGRWKSFLARPCGHAGAMAGGSDDAEAKEGWFDKYFQVPAFSAANPEVGRRGVRVNSIQDLPAAVSAVMALRGEAPDFPPTGDLSLKPWLVNHQGQPLVESLRLQPVTPLSPYDRQLAEANRLVGACLVRESMRNSSSASRVVAATQQTELYGTPVLDLIEQPFAATAVFALVRQQLPAAAAPLANLLLNWFAWRAGEGCGTIVAQVRANGGAPNAGLAAEVLLAGQNQFFQELEQLSDTLIETFFHQTTTVTELSEPPAPKALEILENLPKAPVSDQDRAWAAVCLQLIQAQGGETVLTRFAEQYSAREASATKATNPMTLLAVSLLLGWAWPALKARRIPRQTAVEMGVHLALLGLVARAGAVAPLWPANGPEDRALDFAQTLFCSLFGRIPARSDCFALNALLNLTVHNGPGTLSVMGAKASVSAGNQISTAYAGFMTHTGLAHGGNGYKAVAFLLEVFAGHDPYAIPEAEREALLRQLALEQAQKFLTAKRAARGGNPPEPIPCINHPVFRGQAVNVDPREERLRALLQSQGLRNPFLQFYHHLVEQLFQVGATRNVFCVNVDAVIATLSLELFWPQWQAGQVTPEAMQDAVFRLFLYARMPGIAAEIADHRSRGTDMDCRTPNSELRYLS